MKKKILFVLTKHGKLGNTEKNTGCETDFVVPKVRESILNEFQKIIILKR